jgi:hypothetical protein
LIIDFGIEPENRLLLRLRNVRLVSCPITSGITPERLLFLRLRNLRLVSIPIDFGMELEIWLVLRSRASRIPGSSIESTTPESKLKPRSRYSNDMSIPIVLGIRPENLFLLRSRLFNCVRSPNASGIAPSRDNPLKFLKIGEQIRSYSHFSDSVTSAFDSRMSTTCIFREEFGLP